MTEHVHEWRLDWADRVVVCNICKEVGIDCSVEDMLNEYETLKTGIAFWNRFADDMDAMLNQGKEPSGEFTQVFQVYKLKKATERLSAEDAEYIGEVAIGIYSPMRKKLQAYADILDGR